MLDASAGNQGNFLDVVITQAHEIANSETIHIRRAPVLVWRRKNARDVQRHVPVANQNDLFQGAGASGVFENDLLVLLGSGLEVTFLLVDFEEVRDWARERARLRERNGVVPLDEALRGNDIGEMLPRNSQMPLAGAAGGENDGGVRPAQLGERDVGADVDVAEESAALRDLEELSVEGLFDVLHLRVVRGDAVAGEAERNRKLFVDVDVKGSMGFDELLSDITAGRATSDDRYLMFDLMTRRRRKHEY